LRQITAPLHISVNLAAEDPRLMDFERSILNRLRRVLPQLTIDYVAQSRTGLFEGSGEHYGEIWYEYNGRKLMNRSTIEPVVVAELFQLAGVQRVQFSMSRSSPVIRWRPRHVARG
jgi:hypothetical protein